ncbi:MAG: FtsW/RodA/SpoVE family cell cycle protein, partial [Clostridia bacterium]|nr:FtsW/RodA/SpoVE family cell cycle protein [Clostridia bacterium]
MQAPKKKIKVFLKRGEGGGIDLVFLLLVLVLLAFGLVMVASSSYVNALHNYKDSYYFIKRQLIWALVGIVVIFVASKMDYHVLRRTMLWILGISILFLILVYTPLGIKVNGARRWLGFGPISFQPSELAKLAVIITLSAYITTLGKRMKEFKIGILFPSLLLVVVCGLVAFETHISGAILIFLIGIVLIVVGGVSLKWFGSLAAAGTAALAGFAFLTPYAKTRIDTWLDPFIDPTGAGFQTIQSLYAI